MRGINIWVAIVGPRLRHENEVANFNQVVVPDFRMTPAECFESVEFVAQRDPAVFEVIGEELLVGKRINRICRQKQDGLDPSDRESSPWFRQISQCRIQSVDEEE